MAISSGSWSQEQAETQTVDIDCSICENDTTARSVSPPSPDRSPPSQDIRDSAVHQINFKSNHNAGFLNEENGPLDPEFKHQTLPILQGDDHQLYDVALSDSEAAVYSSSDLKNPYLKEGLRKQNAKARSTKFRRTWLQFLSNILALCSFAVVIIFVVSTYVAEKVSIENRQLNGLMKIDSSSTLTVLRASQGLLSALMTVALNEVFVLLEWDKICQPGGLPFTSLLSVSPTTGVAGILALVQSSAVATTAKLWAVGR